MHKQYKFIRKYYATKILYNKQHAGLRSVNLICSCDTYISKSRCEQTLIKHAKMLKKWVDRSNVQLYWNSVSRQHWAEPSQEQQRCGNWWGFFSGVSLTSAAISIQQSSLRWKQVILLTTKAWVGLDVDVFLILGVVFDSMLG